MQKLQNAETQLSLICPCLHLIMTLWWWRRAISSHQHLISDVPAKAPQRHGPQLCIGSNSSLLESHWAAVSLGSEALNISWVEFKSGDAAQWFHTFHTKINQQHQIFPRLILLRITEYLTFYCLSKTSDRCWGDIMLFAAAAGTVFSFILLLVACWGQTAPCFR